MEFCGVVCEFNPFHNGHEYFLKKVKEVTGKEIVCLMSGDFVQRGGPAIANKFERAKVAVLCGANAVLELPLIYACSNAENFAFGAIKIFKALGIKTIAFGVENASLEVLEKIANLKFQNSIEFQNSFKNEIQNGINFNTALKRSIAKNINEKDIDKILNSPNNILAIEYLTAIKKLDADIVPVAIERSDNGFNSSSPKDKFLGASAIRNLINSNEKFDTYVPKNANSLQFFDKTATFSLDCLQILRIRTLKATELERFYDYSEGIEYRIKKMADKFVTIDEIIKNVSSPRYREARVKKLLLYPTLGVTKDIMVLAKSAKPAVKVLAINKVKKDLLNSFNKNKISLIITNSDYENLSKRQKKIYDLDLASSELYRTLARYEKSDRKMGTLFI